MINVLRKRIKYRVHFKCVCFAGRMRQLIIYFYIAGSPSVVEPNTSKMWCVMMLTKFVGGFGQGLDVVCVFGYGVVLWRFIPFAIYGPLGKKEMI